MAYRLDGTDPFFRAAIGAFNGYAMHGAPLSYAALLKRRATGAWHGIYVVDNGSTGNYCFPMEFSPVGPDQLATDYTTANPFNSTATFNDTANWMIVGRTWDGTTGAGKAILRYRIGAGAWASEAGTSPGANATAAGAGYRHLIGNEAGLGDDANFDVVCVGAIKSELSQGSFESLDMSSFATWQSVFTGAGAALWGFETIATQVDRTGNGADELSRSSGITLVADPAGWVWSATTVFTSYRLIKIPNRRVGPMALRHMFRQPLWLGASPTAVDIVIAAPAATLNLSEPAPVVVETVVAPSAQLNLSAPVPTLVWTAVAPPAALTLSMVAPTVTETVVVPVAALTLSGPTPGVAFAIPSPAALLTLSMPVPAVGSAVVSPAALLTLGGQAPTISESLAAPSARLDLGAPVPAVAEAIPAPSARLDLSAPVPTLKWAVVEPSAALLTLSMPVPSVISGAIVNAPAALLSLSAPAPGLGFAAAPSAATLTLSGAAPVIAWTLPVVPATLTLSAPLPGVSITPAPAAATLTLSAAAPILAEKLVAPSALLTLSAPAPAIVTYTRAAGELVATFLVRKAPIGQLLRIAPAAEILRHRPRAPIRKD